MYKQAPANPSGIGNNREKAACGEFATKGYVTVYIAEDIRRWPLLLVPLPDEEYPAVIN